MADSLITALTANTSPLKTDLLIIEDDPAGTPLTQKITGENLFKIVGDLTDDTSPTLSTTYIATVDGSGNPRKVRADRVGGTGAPTITSISPTTANITATLVTGGVSVHMADVSGLTANRNFVLPAGTAGDIVELRIVTGDDTYAFIVIGNTGISINGGTAATEWSRLFIAGETVRFIATSTSNWAILNDGRIANCFAMSDTNAQNIANITYTKVTFDTADANIGQGVDLTNDKITIRRAGVYEILSQVYYYNFAAGSLQCAVYKNGSQTGMPLAEESTLGMGTSAYGSPKALGIKTLAVADYLELYGRQNSGSAQNPGMKPSAPAILIVREILSS